MPGASRRELGRVPKHRLGRPSRFVQAPISLIAMNSDAASALANGSLERAPRKRLSWIRPALLSAARIAGEGTPSTAPPTSRNSACDPTTSRTRGSACCDAVAQDLKESREARPVTSASDTTRMLRMPRFRRSSKMGSTSPVPAGQAPRISNSSAANMANAQHQDWPWGSPFSWPDK